METLPTLYSKSKTNKVKVWSIHVELHTDNKSVIITKYGYLDGKVTTGRREITMGKNVGRANVTTHYEQAISEAKSKWKNKKNQEYVENLDELDVKTIDKPILPMLAHDFKKRGKDIKFPCFVQPKLDGVRAVYNNGKLTSRTGKLFPHLSHIMEELKGTELILDGELYSNKVGFQDIVGIVRKDKLNKDDKIKQNYIIYLVYDVVLPEHYQNRLEILRKFFKNNKLKSIQLHTTDICEQVDDVPVYHSRYVFEGFEGLMLRNFKGLYEIKNRSKNLQKFKAFKDDEFKIIGYTEGSGKEKGAVIWVCETKQGKEFKTRPEGTYAERKKLYKNADKYVGKYLTVKYFEMTDDGIPRFPIGIAVRDYE